MSEPLTAELIDRMTASEAEAAISERIAAYQAAQLPPAPSDSANPKTASEARAVLDRLERDPQWITAKMTGDTKALETSRRLNEMIIAAGEERTDLYAPDARSKLPIIETVYDGELTQANKLSFIEECRNEYGLDDIQIREIETGVDSRTGKPFVAADFAKARRALATLTSDPERRFQVKGSYERGLFRIAAGVLSHERN